MKLIILALLTITSAISNAQTIAKIDYKEVKELLFENYIQEKDPKIWKLYLSHTNAEEEQQTKHMKEALSNKEGSFTFDADFLARQQQSSKDRMKLESEGRNYMTEFLIESKISDKYDLILFSNYQRNIAHAKSHPEDITQFLIQELIKRKAQPVE